MKCAKSWNLKGASVVNVCKKREKKKLEGDLFYPKLVKSDPSHVPEIRLQFPSIGDPK